MTFVESLNPFLSDFGVPVTAGAVSGLGLLDQNSEIILGGEVVMIDYLLTVKTAEFGGLTYGDAITVDGVGYRVESQPLRIDDGAFSRVPLAPGAGVSPVDPSLQGKQVLWDAQATVIYRGVAAPGVAQNAATWTIKRRTFTAAGVLLTTGTATGAWSNRANLSYS